MIRFFQKFFYLLYLKGSIYFKNRQVQASFTGKTSAIPTKTLFVFLGILIGLFSLFFLLRNFNENISPSIEIKEPVISSPEENSRIQGDIPANIPANIQNQGSPVAAAIQSDKEILKDIKPLYILEKEKQEEQEEQLTPSIKIEEPVISLPIENRQDNPNQSSPVVVEIQPDKEILKDIKPLDILEKENQEEQITPSIKIEEPAIYPPIENRQDNPNQDSTVAAVIQSDKEIPKDIKSLPILEIEKQEENLTRSYMRATGNLVNIRERPFLQSELIARLGAGYIVEKVNRKGDWIYADPGKGFKGWIYYDLLEDVTLEDHQLWKSDSSGSAVIGLTSKSMEDHNNLEREKENIKKLLHLWKLAWGNKDIEIYMSMYSKAFTKPSFNWESYKKHKNLIFSQPGAISIELENIEIKWDNYFMMANFIQKYHSGSLNSTITKMIHFQQEEEGWKIVKEFVVKR